MNTLGYVDEFYDNLICFGCSVTDGTPISVTAGATTSGINFALAIGGRISGTVTDAGTGAPIQNAFVDIYTSGGAYVTSAAANTSGSYMNLTGLPAGVYVARTFVIGQVYVNEIYDNIPCPALQCNVTAGTPIPVTPGATTPNINFALTGGGVISGKVTDAATNMPLANVVIDVYDSTGDFVDTFFTDGSGNYTATGLATGSYYVVTLNDFGYVDEIYDNIVCVPCFVTIGTPVAVTVGATVSNIDFALDKGGDISGDVKDLNTGAPIESIVIEVFTASGEFIAFGVTDALGNYSLNRGIPTGTYFARTGNSAAYINKLYKDIQCLNCDITEGTPIEVTNGATTTDIKFTLQKGGRISGTIRNASTSELLNFVEVQIFDSTGRPVVSVFSNTGSYVTDEGLPSGNYYARTFNFLGLYDAIYNSITCFSCSPTIGNAIPVTIGQTTSPINFSLCPAFSLSQSSRLFDANGGEGGFSVTSLGGCGWAAVSNASWIEITSDPVSTGNGPVTYLVRDNPGPAPRTGTISVANQTFTVTQGGRSASVCTFGIEPLFASFESLGGFGTINVIAPAGCAWKSESNSSWITTSAQCCGIGNGSIAYTVAPNLTGSARSGVITIAGKKFSVKQR
jgi:hypothetical protein